MSCYVVSRLGSSAGLGAGPGPGLGRHLSRPTLQTVLATHFQDNKLKVSPTCQLRRTEHVPRHVSVYCLNLNTIKSFALASKSFF